MLKVSLDGVALQYCTVYYPFHPCRVFFVAGIAHISRVLAEGTPLQANEVQKVGVVSCCGRSAPEGIQSPDSSKPRDVQLWFPRGALAVSDAVFFAVSRCGHY